MIDFVRTIALRTSALMPLRNRKNGDEPVQRVRYAVVGLGYIAQSAVLPAFAHAKGNSELAALVSDSRPKMRKLGEEYDVDLQFTYEEYEDLCASGAIDAVYIALPNSMHREYTEIAARHGVHVLCEKPMAVTADECRAMRHAAESNGIKLMVAYRLHFEPANLGAAELAKSRKLGDIRIFNSVFTMQVKAGDIRLKRSLGGGVLYDIGIYCINAARMIFRAEPLEVFAAAGTSGDARFNEVDEMVAATLRYPGERLATFVTSFGAADSSRYEIVGTKGRLALDPAYEIGETLVHHQTIDGRTRTKRFFKRDQFAPELEYFSDCVLTDKQPEPSALEGLADVQIIQALHTSTKTGRPVRLHIRGDAHPVRSQAMYKRPVRRRKLVAVAAPHD
ncbi:MAG: Gfo/Idh/MocA family oxidoreductase [Gemmatimonadaceae bacterium]